MKYFIVAVSLSIFCVSFGFANRGMMPFNPYVQIFEPNQRAMIAWNGTDQILLLSTDPMLITTASAACNGNCRSVSTSVASPTIAA